MLLQGGDAQFLMRQSFILVKYINYTYLFYITFWDSIYEGCKSLVEIGFFKSTPF